MRLVNILRQRASEEFGTTVAGFLTEIRATLVKRPPTCLGNSGKASRVCLETSVAVVREPVTCKPVIAMLARSKMQL